MRSYKGAIKTITALALGLMAGVMYNNPAFADTVDYNVNVAPSLKLTIPSSSIVLNLNPPTKTFDSEDFTVEVGTNNQTGYTLTLSTPNDDTFLNRDSSSDGVSAKLYTLDSGTYTETTFTPDKWGYSINSNTAIPSTITSGYIPFQSGNTLMESSTAVNKDETELTFAAKIDYLQPAGSYATDLIFNLVANPLVDYIQDFDITACRTLASSADYTVVDKRDGNSYTIRYINGNCWMTQNLRYVGDTGSTLPSGATAGSMIMKAATSNISTDTTVSDTDLDQGNTYDAARIHIGVDDNDNPTVWYNYAAASAMTITGPSNTNAQVYDICPAGWRLPAENEGDILNYKTEFKPVRGGFWWDGNFGYVSYGRYWNSTSYSATDRRMLNLRPNDFIDSYDGRVRGFYIRCIRNATISDISNMQDITPSIVANTAEGETATLKDTRDNQTYTVAKINGNVWMTRNLAIGCDGAGSDYGSARIAIQLSSTTSNITTAWPATSSILNSLSLGNDYTDPRMECSNVYGAYYNYAAVTAGTIVGNSNSNTPTVDICPAGWRLPTNSEQVGITSYVSAYQPVAGGYWYTGSYNAVAGGYWWSSTPNGAIYRDNLQYLSATNTLSKHTGTVYRYSGFHLRCIAK